MRTDLGQEQVYNFIGEVLKEQGVDLSNLMEQAISGREHLDDLISRMEKTLSEEHKRLLELAKQERMDEQSLIYRACGGHIMSFPLLACQQEYIENLP
ncbi:hypothetical protein [Bacillus smithii]|uniref:hypothetical protein n=1 Tax=Bacillus smithii TaxID=1479 RepID=UPI002E1E042E|nr:hypothetical protein [Bacillus smithii]